MAEDAKKRNKRIAEWQKEHKTKLLVDKDAGELLRQSAADAGQTISDYIRDKLSGTNKE